MKVLYFVLVLIAAAAAQGDVNSQSHDPEYSRSANGAKPKHHSYKKHMLGGCTLGAGGGYLAGKLRGKQNGKKKSHFFKHCMAGAAAGGAIAYAKNHSKKNKPHHEKNNAIAPQ